MRFVFLCSVTVLVSCQPGCRESAGPNSRDVFVSFEVESAFQNDFVTLLLDSKTLLESRVTTNYSIGLAWSSGLQKLSNDAHILYFAVNYYGAHNTYTIDLTNDTSTVTINFDRSTKMVRFQQYKGILLRE